MHEHATLPRATLLPPPFLPCCHLPLPLSLTLTLPLTRPLEESIKAKASSNASRNSTSPIAVRLGDV